MRPEFNDTGALEHDDQVGHADGRKTMGDEDGYVAGVAIRSGGSRVALEERVFSFGIERRRGLVEHQQQRTLPHESPRQSQFLPLPEGDLDASGPSRAQLRLQARGQARNNVSSAG